MSKDHRATMSCGTLAATCASKTGRFANFAGTLCKD
jgi:hypothetical protein